MTLPSSPGEQDLVLLRQVPRALVTVEARDVSSVDDRVHEVAELLWKINCQRNLETFPSWGGERRGLTLDREHAELEPLGHGAVPGLELHPEIVALS